MTPSSGEDRLAVQLAAPGAMSPGEFDHEVHAHVKGAGFWSWTRWRGPVLHVAVIVVLLAIWQLVFSLKIWDPVFVPSPSSVWDAAVEASTVHDGAKGYSGVFLYEHLWASMRRILIASAFAIVVGVPLGLLLGTSRWSRTLLEPGVTFADLKGVLSMFARAFFGPDVRTRFLPSYFPFTEPSAELYVSCLLCAGKGCPACKRTGWMEIGGCGMVDPNVFEAVGYDAEEVTGFAFGFGIERPAMLKYGINDIRLLFENDLRFLRQF